MSKILHDVNIGTNLQKLRKAKGLTQEQLCAQMSIAGRPISQSRYAQIETGTRNIFVSDLIVIKRLLGVSFDDIFSGLQPINKYEAQD